MTDVDAVLELEDLVHVYRGRGARQAGVLAVDGVSLQIRPGETLGLVGESGSGKSTLARCAVRLLEPVGGRVLWSGRDVSHLSRRSLRPLRRAVHMVMQDSLAAMNPRARISDIVSGPLRLQDGAQSRQRPTAAIAELERVGLHPELADRYPHELSGGQRQRVGIARALAPSPRLLVADEPVSALDVSVRASILNLLVDLQAEKRFACLFVSHDLGVVEHVADRVAVMYLGQIVEEAPSRRLVEGPQHPYTQALFSAATIPDPARQGERQRVVLTGDIPSPADPPSGCRFHTRCPLAFDRCAAESPEPQVVEGDESHVVRCHLYSRSREVPRLVPDQTHDGVRSSRP